MKTESILGVNILATDYKEFMDILKEDIINKEKRIIVAINPEKIMKMRRDKSLQRFIQNSDYRIPDGVGVLMASKRKDGAIKNRITGVDTMTHLCGLAAKEGFKVFLYGGKEEVVQKTKENLLETYKGLQIVGTQNGYDAPENLVEIINESGAQILFIAMGSPKQELWMEENQEKLHVNIMQGVGGSFDVLGGFVKRAPAWMQSYGLEWLHRLLVNPSRILRQMNLIRFYLLLRKEGKSL